MECFIFKENISYYIDDILENEEKIEFEKHLNECFDCKCEYDAVLSIVNSIREIEDVELPTEFDNILKANLQNEIKNKSFNLKYLNIAAVFILFITSISLINNVKDTQVAQVSPIIMDNRVENTANEELNNMESFDDIMQKRELEQIQTSNTQTINESKPTINVKSDNYDEDIESKQQNKDSDMSPKLVEIEPTTNIQENKTNSNIIETQVVDAPKQSLVQSDQMPQVRTKNVNARINKNTGYQTLKDITIKENDLKKLTQKCDKNYKISYEIGDESILKCTNLYQSENDSSKIYEYEFKGISKGNTTIKLNYIDENEKIVKTLQCSVIVE